MLLGRRAVVTKQRQLVQVAVAAKRERASETETAQVYIGFSAGSILRVPSPKMVGDIAGSRESVVL